MKRLLLAFALTGCAPAATVVTLDGTDYPVRRVTAEPLSPVMTPVRADLNDGTDLEIPVNPAMAASGPALRIGGTADLDTAIRVLALACNRPYDEVKDWGAYSDPIWTDPATGEVAFWTDC